MEDLRLKIGTIQTPHSELSVAVTVDAEGLGWVIVECRERRKADRSGYLILDAKGWAELKELIAAADAKIDELKRTGKLQFKADGFKLVGE